MIILSVCLIAGLIGVGVTQFKDLPRQVTGFDFGEYNLQEYDYSLIQANMINDHGDPQYFYILFYHDEDPQGERIEIRYEEWFYPAIGKSLTFENGALIAENTVPTASAVQTAYQPKYFTAFMNREQIASAADIDDWLILPVEKELVPDADLYYTEGLTFGLQYGELVYIEAIGFEE